MKTKKTYWIITGAVACLAIWGARAKALRSVPAGQETTGEITGKVLFEGTRPQLREIHMNKDPECVRENQGRVVYQQDGAVNPNGTLPNVFVFVKSGAQDLHFSPPSTPVVLDQQGCIFVPHVLGIMVGQTLKVLNSDFTTHNVHAMGNNQARWNESQPPGAAPFYKKFEHPGIMIPVDCNEHPWMKAYIGVVSNPFYNVTGPNGTFTIKNVPPGTYTIKAWTATFGNQEKTVTVRAHETSKLEFTFRHE